MKIGSAKSRFVAFLEIVYISAHIISSEKGKRGNELDIDVVGKLELSSLSTFVVVFLFVLFLTKNVNIPNDQVVNGSRRPPDPEYKDGLHGNWLTPHQENPSLHPHKYKEI